MLKNEINTSVDLVALKEEMKSFLPSELKQYVVNDSQLLDLNYPVLEYPKKVKSMSFDKLSVVEGTLTGIKGQYLMFDYLNVLNIRKHQGYMVSIEY